MPQTTAQRTASYRDRQRAKGLRPITLWVPDLRDPAVRAEIDRQCRLIANADQNDPDFDAEMESQLILAAEIDQLSNH